MYIKINAGVPEAYSVAQLRADNPQTSFPAQMTDELLAEWGVYPVVLSTTPVCGEKEVVEEDGYFQLEDGSWTQAWLVRPMNAQELEALAREKDELRKIAYQNEADPLFFKAQRGEATMQEWLDKVQEIKNRYPTN